MMENIKKESRKPYDIKKIAMWSYYLVRSQTGSIDLELCFALLSSAVCT